MSIVVPAGADEATDATRLTNIAADPAWLALKEAATSIQGDQVKDGSIPDAARHGDARARVATIVDSIRDLAPLFPHDADYLAALQADFERWVDGGFGVPDFYDSLVAFQPQQHRVDGLRHLVVFPMYTQNGNPNRNFEAVLLRVFWPDWLARLEDERYDNPQFLSIAFEAFTAGYDTNSAVLFPETVAVGSAAPSAKREVPKFTWGAIFSDREAARFRTVTSAAAEATRLELPEDAARLVADQALAQDAFGLWDMIHDRTHSHGDLPFDPFMIKQRQPFWMYGLEELRCDLTAFKEAVRLEADGVIRGYSAQVDPGRFGWNTHALVALYCEDRMAAGEVRGAVEDHPEVEAAYTVAGEASAILHVRARDTSHLEAALERIRDHPGVTRSQTQVVLSTLFEPPFEA